MKRAFHKLFRKSSRILASPLGVEQLSDRLVPSVSPIGAPIDVTGLDHAAGIDASYLGERTVARADNGNFAVVWNSADPNTGGIYYRLFDAAGTALSDARQIDGTDPNDSQPTIAMNDNGDFAIAWITGDVNDADNDIYTNRFDAAGNRVGHIGPAAVSPLNDYNPTIAFNNAGTLVVAFNQRNDPRITGRGSDLEIATNLWSQPGVDRQGAWLNVCDSQCISERPSIALNDTDQGAVAFVARDAIGAGHVFVYPFTSQGLLTGRGMTHRVGPEYTSEEPSVAINESGTILVGYTNVYSMDPGLRGPIVDQQIIVHRWTWSFATALGEQQVLNREVSEISRHSSRDYHPSVALNDDGTFVVAAQQELYTTRFGQDEPVHVSTSVVAQVFRSNGTALTESFEAESTADAPLVHTTNEPSVGTDARGNFVVSYVDGAAAGAALKVRLFGENFEPRIERLDGPAFGVPGQGFAYQAEVTDPDQAEGLVADWQVLDADGQEVAAMSGDANAPFEFTPTAAGAYTIQLTVTDAAGATATSAMSLTVDVEPEPEPVVPFVMTLSVGDSFDFVDADGDLVHVTYAGKGGSAVLTFTGTTADGSDLASIVAADSLKKATLAVRTEGTAEVGAIDLSGLGRKPVFQSLLVEGNVGRLISRMNINRLAIDGVLGGIEASGFGIKSASINGRFYGKIDADTLAALLVAEEV